MSYLCPSLTLLLHREEGGSQGGGEGGEVGRSGPAEGWTDGGRDGRMEEMKTFSTTHSPAVLRTLRTSELVCLRC